MPARKKHAGVYFITTNAESMLSELKGMAVATSAKDGFYVEYNEGRKSAFADFLGSSVEKVGADLKHSIVVLSRLGIEFAKHHFMTRRLHITCFSRK